MPMSVVWRCFCPVESIHGSTCTTSLDCSGWASSSWVSATSVWLQPSPPITGQETSPRACPCSRWLALSDAVSGTPHIILIHSKLLFFNYCFIFFSLCWWCSTDIIWDLWHSAHWLSPLCDLFAGCWRTWRKSCASLSWDSLVFLSSTTPVWTDNKI